MFLSSFPLNGRIRKTRNLKMTHFPVLHRYNDNHYDTNVHQIRRLPEAQISNGLNIYFLQRLPASLLQSYAPFSNQSNLEIKYRGYNSNPQLPVNHLLAFLIFLNERTNNL